MGRHQRAKVELGGGEIQFREASQHCQRRQLNRLMIFLADGGRKFERGQREGKVAQEAEGEDRIPEAIFTRLLCTYMQQLELRKEGIE